MNGKGLRSLPFLVAFFGLSECETTEQHAQNAGSPTPEHFNSTAIVLDDDSGDTALISARSERNVLNAFIHAIVQSEEFRSK